MATKKSAIVRHRMSFTANDKLYKWILSSAKDTGITISAFIAMKLGETMKNEAALENIGDLMAEMKKQQELQKNA